MPSSFERPDTVPIDLPEPYQTLLAFLSDLHEQVEIIRKTIGGNLFATELLDNLELKITSLALIVSVKAGSE